VRQSLPFKKKKKKFKFRGNIEFNDLNIIEVKGRHIPFDYALLPKTTFFI